MCSSYTKAFTSFHNNKFHISLILQEGKVWMTHQIDKVQSTKIWVTCAHGYFYNLRVPKPAAVVPGQGTELKMSMPEIPKVKWKAKETKKVPKKQRKLKKYQKQRKLNEGLLYNCFTDCSLSQSVTQSTNCLLVHARFYCQNHICSISTME